MSNSSLTTRNQVLTPAERRQLLAWVQAKGEDTVRGELAVGKLPLARLLAGLPVLRSTLAVARGGLDRQHGASEAR